MTYLKTAALAVLGTLALTAGASAAVVCNEDGDCWRTNERLTYPLRLACKFMATTTIPSAPNNKWRDAREGRGYYRGGVWVGF
jgi:hypothetical protein